MKRIKIIYVGLVASFITIASNVSAQVSPPMSMYFLNEYIYNPAVAGKDAGVTVAGSYKNNLVGSNGQTDGNTITVEYGKGKNGFGLLANIDKDGILNANKFAASYAYKLQMANDGALRFGVSAGVSSQKINTGSIIGDLDDNQIGLFNEKGYVFNGDVGVQYSNQKLSLSAVAPNVRSLLSDEEIDAGFNYNKFYLSASYQVYQNDDITISPKVLYRSLIGYNDVVDAGVNVQLADKKFNVMAFYHSNNVVSFAAGFSILEKCQFQASYSLPIDNNLKKYSYGAVELGLRFNINK